MVMVFFSPFLLNVKLTELMMWGVLTTTEFRSMYIIIEHSANNSLYERKDMEDQV